MITRKDINKKHGLMIVHQDLWEDTAGNGDKLKIFITIQFVDTSGICQPLFNLSINGWNKHQSENLNTIVGKFNQLMEELT